MDLDRFCRQTKAAAFREAAEFLREALGKIDKTMRRPAEGAIRPTIWKLEDQARKFEQS